MILAAIAEAQAAGARLEKACELVGLSARTVERWQQNPSGEDGRHGPKRRTSNALTELEVARVMAVMESPEHVGVIREICERAGVDSEGLVLHSDNGLPMRGNTMIATLQALGIVPSFSRPHVSDDNPYSEALFRTLKHGPTYPRLPFASVIAANQWVARFVTWYNGEHRHSALRFVSPKRRTLRRGTCPSREARLALPTRTPHEARAMVPPHAQLDPARRHLLNPQQTIHAAA